MNGAGQSSSAPQLELADALVNPSSNHRILSFWIKITLHMHDVLPVTRLVIPVRGPARSSAALHNGLLRAFLFCNHAYDPELSLHSTLDHHVL
jgi:hypothetical protein